MNAVASRNVKFVSHSDQGGRGDGVQIMVHRGYAYIGHGYSNGISVLDVRDEPRSCHRYQIPDFVQESHSPPPVGFGCFRDYSSMPETGLVRAMGIERERVGRVG